MVSNTKKILLFLFLFFTFSQAELVAQDSKVDSLMKVVQTSADDSNKVNTLNLLAWEMVITAGDYEKTFLYANQAIALSQQIDYKKGHAKALNIIGAAYMFQGNYSEALTNYEASLKIKEEMGDKKGIASAYSNIGLVYMYQGDYSKSLKNHKASLKIEEEIKDKEGIAGSYNNIGIIYEEIGNYPEALNNYFASLKIKEEIGDKKGIANTLSNIGAIKEFQHNYKEALKDHLKALELRKELGDQRGISDSYNNIGNIYKELGNYVEALKNQLASLKIFEEIGSKSGIASTYNNIGLIYSAQGDSAFRKGNKSYALMDRYPKALEQYLLSIKIREEIGDKTGVATSSVNLGSVNLKLRKFGDAHKYLNEGLSVSMEIGNKKAIRDCYKELSALDSAQGNMGKAYEDYKMFIVYRDSLYNEEKVQQTVQLQMKFEIEKDQILEAQLEEKRLKRIKDRDTRQFIIIFLVVFAVIGSIILLGFVKVPPALAQGLNFVSLLLVFESILVFTDPYMDRFTNGIPVYKLLVNILWAISIFPIHRFLERRFKKRLQVK